MYISVKNWRRLGPTSKVTVVNPFSKSVIHLNTCSTLFTTDLQYCPAHSPISAALGLEIIDSGWSYLGQKFENQPKIK